ncbi:unnamed protein product [Urochloa decumbens]|uniref:NB-ARC domain-containing protein n=1 Tax=Urochloa decumbens TaxID=240449 RepID=A0ABC9AZW3_9POAL
MENTGENEKTWSSSGDVIVEVDSDEQPKMQKSSLGEHTRKEAESWTLMASEPFSYIQNQGKDEKTGIQQEKFQTADEQLGHSDKQPTTQKKSSVTDTRKHADSRLVNRTSIPSEPCSPMQRGTRWRPRNVYSPVEKALGIKYVSRQLAKLEAFRAKNDIASIKLEMELMAIIIEENKDNNGPSALPEKWVMHLQDMVHDIEDFIDIYNWLRVRSWRHTHAHMSYIVHLKNRMNIVREWQRNAISSKNEGIASASGPSAGSILDYAPESKFIGMYSLRDELMQLSKLDDDEYQRKWNHDYSYEYHNPQTVIAIVGPRGAGKTALARSFYDRQDYKAMAWVVASECSSAGYILSKIRQQVHRKSSENSLDMPEKIWCDGRYLVVIDDLQQAGMWHDIQNALAGADPGSRIIVTTSIQSVAATCSTERYTYRVQGLNSNESRELFLRKVGRKEDGWPAHEHALEDILSKCGGLPVALISMANYLRGQGPNLTERMAKFGNYLAGPSGAFDGMNRALTKSYNNLPDSVHRSCLLSLSIFPQGHVVERKSLTRRWIAEGLVVGDGSLSAEQVANVCFDDLIDRNIIEPVSIGINSKVKRGRVHDLLLEVIINKSVCKNFVALIRMDEPHHRGACPVRRLSVHGGTAESTRIAMAIGLNHLRSLTICRGVPLNFRTCSLLRVLDMEGCDQIDDRVLSVICSLVFLKYLSLRHTDVCRIPAKIRNLYDLETLDIRQTSVELLPMEVWMLPRLTDLFGRFHLPRELRDKKKRRKVQRFFEEEGRLQAVSGFVIEGYNGYEPIVLHMRLLRKIKIWCQGASSWDSKRLLASCLEERLSENNALESLSIDFGNTDVGEYFANNVESSSPCRLSSIKLRGKLSRVPGFIFERTARGFIMPLAINLSELQLSSTGLSLEELSVLQQLPRLLYLKLAEDSTWFQGDSFVVERDGFPSLERLCFQAAELPPVLIGEGAMTSLKSLHLLCPWLYPWKYEKQSTTLEIENSKCWDIKYLKNLNEVVVHASVSREELAAWEKRAREHTNRPKVVVQLQS